MILSSTASVHCRRLLLFTPGNPKATPSLKLTPPVSASSVNFRLCVTPKSSAFDTRENLWEEPDYGSESDFEEEEDVRDDWITESDNEGERSLSGFSTKTPKGVDEEYEVLVKEVELLLTAEEQTLLKQNETPVLSKISTNKWAKLQSLALSAQISSMDKLIECGVDIDSRDKEGFTALHWAVIGKKEAVISHLLRKGANLHVRDKDGATPLHYAVQVGAMQTVKLLIKHKVDVNVADDEGWTPLHVAIQTRSRDIAKILLVNGADKRRRNKDGNTPLDLCICYGKDFKSYELAKLPLKRTFENTAPELSRLCSQLQLVVGFCAPTCRDQLVNVIAAFNLCPVHEIELLQASVALNPECSPYILDLILGRPKGESCEGTQDILFQYKTTKFLGCVGGTMKESETGHCLIIKQLGGSSPTHKTMRQLFQIFHERERGKQSRKGSLSARKTTIILAKLRVVSDRGLDNFCFSGRCTTRKSLGADPSWGQSHNTPDMTY
ncbi:hypothetical protein H6P81_010349 [Aristolochia fimbriata]|uniref:Uncharacterized protein n=1 Tax=Aristolochia fimbriata TaxID=158543 RepID=A0AAV7EPQ3_ARIFI|nr:hypothetical protein H6P81_010349 [Aristolochia fimbriata]